PAAPVRTLPSAVGPSTRQVLPLPEELCVDGTGHRRDLAPRGGEARPTDAPQHLRIDPFLALAARRELALLQRPFGGELLEGAARDTRSQAEDVNRLAGEERPAAARPAGEQLRDGPIH